jgi:hypothetical protein
MKGDYHEGVVYAAACYDGRYLVGGHEHNLDILIGVKRLLRYSRAFSMRYGGSGY